MAGIANPDLSARVPRTGGAPMLSPEAVAQGAGNDLLVAAEAASMAGNYFQKRTESRAEMQVGQALTRASDELETLRVKLESDPDTANRHEKFRAAAKEIMDRETAAIGYRPARDAFITRGGRVVGSILTQVKNGAAEEEKEMARATLDTTNDDLLNKALFAKSPAERAAYLAAVDENLEGAVRSGTLKAITAHARRRSGLGRFEVAQADMLIKQSPAAAIKALSDPEQFKYLDAPARAKLIGQAQQRAESLNVQAQASFTHDMTLYTQARAAGQPVDAAIEADLLRRAKSFGGVKAQHFETTKRFYDRVESYTGKSLPELRETVVELGRGNLEDKQVARALDKQVTADTRELNKVFQEGLKEFQTIRETGEKSANLPTLLQQASDLGGPQMRESVEALDAYYSRINHARTKDSAEGVRQRIAMINEDRRGAQGGSLTLQDVQEIGALQRALEIKEREAKADSAGYVLKYYPTIAEGFSKAAETGDQEGFTRAAAAMREVQRREGIAEQILAKPAAARLEAQLNSPNVADRLAAVDAARQGFGPELWPLIKSQLNQGKDLPPETEVLASLPPGATIDRARVIEAFRLKEEEWSKQLGSQKTTLDDMVRTQGAEILRSFNMTPGGSPYADAFIQTARRLSYLNHSAGQSAGVAVKNAWDEAFNRHWALVGNVRIPKLDGQPIADPARVQMSQRIVVAQLGKLDLLDPVAPGLEGLTEAQRRAQLARAVQSFGFWVSDAKETGAYLYAGPNQPVRWSDGSAVFLPFDAAKEGNLEASLRRVNRKAAVRRIGENGQEEVIQEDTGARR